MARKTTSYIRTQKGKAPLVVLTASTAPFARALDPLADILLVGDSLGMVLYGYDNTLPVSLDLMIRHGEVVARCSQQALVVVDMPFATYQESPQQAYRSGARVLAETGCQAIKIEGGVEMAPTIRFLSERAIPVMAHVGMMPQHVHRWGWSCQGMDEPSRARIIADAKAVEEAGAFAVVIENVEETLAAEITSALHIPTIGIGASAACDGQVLVSEDMAGMTSQPPRFVKRYGDLAAELERAATAYASDVRSRRFPAGEHVKKKS